MRSIRILLPLAGLTVVVLALASGCGSSSYSPTNPTPTTPTSSGTTSTADVTITIVGMNGSQSYLPNPATVKVGQTVSWRNADSVTHTATADGGAFNTGNIAPGAVSAPIAMSSAASVAYHCTVHPTMVGTLTVQ
jgi:plastocyanin